MKNRALLLAVFLAYVWLFSIAFGSAESATLAYLSTNWHKTVAKVVQSTAEGPCTRSGGAVHKMAYSYTIGATTYTGTRKSFASVPCESETDAKRVASEFPVGSELQVRVHPAHPNLAVVFPGQLFARDYWQLVGLALCLALIPWGAWRYAKRAA